MATITHLGVTLMDEATNGAGWRFLPGLKRREMVEVAAPQGDGYWLKPGPLTAAVHRLEMQWRVANPGTWLATMEGWDMESTGDLVVPDWGTLTNCKLSDKGGIDNPFPTDGGWIITATLTFTQYP
jgi:hypothetical protein